MICMFVGVSRVSWDAGRDYTSFSEANQASTLSLLVATSYAHVPDAYNLPSLAPATKA